MINLKTYKEIKIMKEGGKIAAHILKIIQKKAVGGITTKQLDDIAKSEIKKAGVKASFLGHAGFPANICTSINSEVVHGIPGRKTLKEGDIIGIDFGVLYKGYHTDTAVTVGVGKINAKKKRLIKIAKESLNRGIEIIKPGVRLGDIQNTIQEYVEKEGFSVVRDLAGHGIGKELQENPSIPNYGSRGTGPILKEGMVIAIEPMITDGRWQVKILADGWTVVTADGSDSAHFEHTVAVVKNGYEVLTKI